MVHHQPAALSKVAIATLQAFVGLSPQSRVQLRQAKVFDAIVMPYCALYRSNRSTFDSFNGRWVRWSAGIIESRQRDALVQDCLPSGSCATHGGSQNDGAIEMSDVDWQN